MPEKKKKVVAYLRVSTVDQDLEKNKHDILKLANDKDLGKVHFVEEKVSGTVPWRKRKLAGILEELSKGDSIIVSELSRLGRSMLECMEILSIAVNKEINIYAIKGNWQLDGSLQSKVMAMAFSIASEIERDLISQRTKEALRIKKASGAKLGRPEGPGKSKLDDFKPEIEALLSNGTSKSFIAKRYKTTRGNLYNWLDKNKTEIKPKTVKPEIQYSEIKVILKIEPSSGHTLDMNFIKEQLTLIFNKYEGKPERKNGKNYLINIPHEDKTDYHNILDSITTEIINLNQKHNFFIEPEFHDLKTGKTY